MVDTNLVPPRFTTPLNVSSVDLKLKQVVINSLDWAVGHMEDLRMPLLILHGIDDQLSLLSGSR